MTDTPLGEEHALKGNEWKVFELRALNGAVLKTIVPNEPWTHTRLVRVLADLQPIIDEAFGADVFVGTKFIGTTQA